MTQTRSIVSSESKWIREGVDLAALAHEDEPGWFAAFLIDLSHKTSTRATQVSKANPIYSSMAESEPLCLLILNRPSSAPANKKPSQATNGLFDLDPPSRYLPPNHPHRPRRHATSPPRHHPLRTPTHGPRPRPPQRGIPVPDRFCLHVGFLGGLRRGHQGE